MLFSFKTGKGIIILSLNEEKWTLPRILAILEGGNLNMLKALDRPDHHLLKKDISSRKLFGSKRNLFIQNPNFAGEGENCQQNRSSKSLFSKKRKDVIERKMSSLKSRYVNINAELYSYHLSKRIMKLCLQFGIKRESSKVSKPIIHDIDEPEKHNMFPTATRNIGLLRIPLVTGVIDYSDISEESHRSNIDGFDVHHIDSEARCRSKMEIKSQRSSLDLQKSDSYMPIDVISSSQENCGVDTLNLTQCHSGLGYSPTKKKMPKMRCNTTALNNSSRQVRSLTNLEDSTDALSQKHTEINPYPSQTSRIENEEIPRRLEGRRFSDNFVALNNSSTIRRQVRSLTNLEDAIDALAPKDVGMKVIKSKMNQYPSQTSRTENEEIRMQRLERRSYSDNFITVKKKVYGSSHFALVEDMCQDLDRLLK